jgi:uncharacterized protein YaaN involved in tellurite resistance
MGRFPSAAGDGTVPSVVREWRQWLAHGTYRFCDTVLRRGRCRVGCRENVVSPIDEVRVTTPPCNAAGTPVDRLWSAADDGPGQRERIDQLKRSIDIRSSTMVLTFGRAAERQMARFADTVLDQVLARGTADVRNKLTDIRVVAEGLAVDRLTAGTGVVASLFFSEKREISRFSERFRNARQRIDILGFRLENRAREIGYGLAVLDTVMEQNLSRFRDLTMHIRAAEEVLADGRSAVAANHTRDDMQAGIDRLDRRVRNLRRSRTIALAMLPTIRQVQSSGAMLADDLWTIIGRDIPSWKTRLLQHIEPLRRRHGLAPMATARDAVSAAPPLAASTSDASPGAPSPGDADVDALTETMRRLLDRIEAVEHRERDAVKARQACRDTLRAAESEFLAHIAGGVADDPPAMPA